MTSQLDPAAARRLLEASAAGRRTMGLLDATTSIPPVSTLFLEWAVPHVAQLAQQGLRGDALWEALRERARGTSKESVFRL